MVNKLTRTYTGDTTRAQTDGVDQLCAQIA
jgi:hypothetical protein